MSLFDIFRPVRYDADDDPLARPFPNEVSDLSVHVDACTRRYRDLRIAACLQISATHRNTMILAALVIVTLAINWDKLSPFLALFI